MRKAQSDKHNAFRELIQCLRASGMVAKVAQFCFIVFVLARLAAHLAKVLNLQ
jgi:hypothetical protein